MAACADTAYTPFHLQSPDRNCFQAPARFVNQNGSLPINNQEDSPTVVPVTLEKHGRQPEHWCFQAAKAAKSLQSCPTLCDPTDGSPPGSPVPGILEERTLEHEV